MEIADFIQFGLLLAAIISIYISQKRDKKQRKLEMFAEYTRRYQDIFMNMPEDIYDGTANVDTKTKRYMRLYFDLCSEEYHLWQDKVVPEKVWNLWVEGMQIACNHQIYKCSWDALKEEYSQDFMRYFERNVINNKQSTNDNKESTFNS